MTDKSAEPARTRRGNGEGTKPYQQPDGRWRSEIMIGLRPDGSRIRKRIYGATSAECTRNIRAEKKRIDEGYVTPSSTMRFIEWLDLWLDTTPTSRVSKRSMLDYKGKVDRYVRPHPSSMKRLDKLQAEDIEKIYRSMREKIKPNEQYPRGRAALSESTIAGLHRVLRRGLNVAIQRKRLSINPIKMLDAPKEKPFKPTVLTTDQVRKLITAALALDDGARWVLALMLGPRQGEALGLAWPDIDFTTGKLTIDRELFTLPWKHGCDGGEEFPSCGRKRGDGCPERRDGGFFLGDPKSEAGHRSAMMPMQLKDALRRHRKVQLANRSTDWVPFTDEDGTTYDLVFSRDDGRPTDYRADWGAWKAFCESVGVPAVRPHDGRHTAATTLLLLKVPPRVVMEMLGWSQMSMLTRYQHVLDEMKQDAADQLTNLWAEEPDGSNVVSMDAMRRRRGQK